MYDNGEICTDIVAKIAAMGQREAPVAVLARINSVTQNDSTKMDRIHQ